MKRVHLVIVLRFFAVENDVERDLIGLVDDRPMARGHSANVKVNYARDRSQKLLRARDQFIRGIRIGRVGPENHHMRKHGRSVKADRQRVKGKVRFALVIR